MYWDTISERCLRVLASLVMVASAVVATVSKSEAQLRPDDVLNLGIQLLLNPERANAQSAPGDRVRPAPARQADAPRGNSARSNIVAEAQRHLNELGYEAGEVDGRLGPTTRSAILRFQRDQRLPATGRADEGLLHTLRGRLAGAYAEQNRPSAPTQGGQAEASASIKLLDGFDLPGGDYRSGLSDPSLKGIGVDSCARACTLDVPCRGFTYNTQARVCFLKNAVGDKERFAAAVSGTKGGASSPILPAGPAASGGSTDSAPTIISSREDKEPAAVAIGGPSAAPANFEQDGPAVLIEGRVAAVADADLGSFFEGRDLKKDLQKLVRDYALLLDDAYMRNDEAAIQILFSSDIVLVEQILLEARGKPLTSSEKIAIANVGSQALYGYVALTPFERQRAIQAVRARATEIIRTDLPPQPIPLRVYCHISLGQYEFKNSAFPISRHGCNGEIQGVPRPQHDIRSWPEFFDHIGFSPEEAEAFANESSGRYWQIMSYDTDLTVVVHKSEAQSVVSASLSPRTNIVLYAPGSATVPLRRLDTPVPDAADAPAAQASAPEGVIVPGGMPSGPLLDVKSAQTRAELLAAAGDVRPLPLEETFRISSPERILGIIQPQHAYRVTPPKEQPARSELFFAYGGERIPALADALGVPAENFISLSLTDENESISAIVGLLPDATQSFSRQAPADHYGRSTIGYTAKVAVTGVHAFQMPFGKPVLVLSLHPFEARFVDTTDSRKPDATLETFDLRTAAVEVRQEVLPVPDRAAIVWKSMEATGQAPESTISQMMRFEGQRIDAFERQSLLEGMLDRARQSQDLNDRFWVTGTVSFGEYDFETGRFPALRVELETIEGWRYPDLPANSLSFILDEGIFDLPLDRDAARAWTIDHKGKAARVRALLRANDGKAAPPTYRIDVTVLEAEIIRMTAPARLRDPNDVLHRYDLERAATEVSAPANLPQAAQGSNEPDLRSAQQRDILGVRLGHSLEEAAGILANQLGKTERFQTTAELRSARRPQPKWQSYSHAILLHAPEQMMIVALYSEPPASGDKVTTIVRSQAFRSGAAPHPTDVIEQLIAKYGEPQTDYTKTGHPMIWVDNKDAEGMMSAGGDRVLASCNRHLRSSYAQTKVLANVTRRSRLSASSQQQQPEWFTETGDLWSSSEIDPLYFEQVLRPLSQCTAMGEIMFAILDVDADGHLAALHIVISNPAEVGGLAVKNEKAVVGAPSPGIGGSDIKL